MSKKVCYQITDLPFGVTLEQSGPDNFTVTYGKQVKARLSYSTACAELGAAIMHALACDDRLDNRTKAEAKREG